MPKERTHWHLAARAAKNLPAGPLADATSAYDAFVLAGAVSHDSAYYAVGNAFAKAAADRLHGSGGADSYAPFRALAARHREHLEPGVSFGFGALTHLVADATFHPLVYSWTGEEDFSRHQALETALDRHFEALWGPAPAQTFASLIDQTGPDLVGVHSAFSGADSGSWIAAHARLQRLFACAPLSLLAGRRAALFYAGPPTRHPDLEGTLEWIDPVTGTPDAASLEQLVGRFDSRIALLAREWEGAWTQGTLPFDGVVGPGLDTDVACDRTQTKRFFSPRSSRPWQDWRKPR